MQLVSQQKAFRRQCPTLQPKPLRHHLRQAFDNGGMDGSHLNSLHRPNLLFQCSYKSFVSLYDYYKLSLQDSCLCLDSLRPALHKMSPICISYKQTLQHCEHLAIDAITKKLDVTLTPYGIISICLLQLLHLVIKIPVRAARFNLLWPQNSFHPTSQWAFTTFAFRRRWGTPVHASRPLMLSETGPCGSC